MPFSSWRLSQLDLIEPPVGCHNLLLGGETSINGDIAAGVVGSRASSGFCGVLMGKSMVLKALSVSAGNAWDEGMTTGFRLGLWKEEDAKAKASGIHLSETIRRWVC